MKEMLLYNYNLEVKDLEESQEHTYSFYIDYDKFYLEEIKRPLEDIVKIYELEKNTGTRFHKIIPNTSGQIYTKYDDKNYCLLKVRGPENIEVDTLDMINSIIPTARGDNSLKRSNWGELWSAKVDYLEYQVSELGTTHKTVRKSFSYYVGLAENAISYYNTLSPDNLPTYIQKRRISYPLTNSAYKDPLDIVIDYKVRDFASYFKAKFFSGENPLEDVKLLVKKNILNPLEYNLLFTRLLYPSYYFDAVHLVLEKGYDDDTLIKYIEKVSLYEEFLNDVFLLFKEKSSMLKIDWLIKRS